VASILELIHSINEVSPRLSGRDYQKVVTGSGWEQLYGNANGKEGTIPWHSIRLYGGVYLFLGRPFRTTVVSVSIGKSPLDAQYIYNPMDLEVVDGLSKTIEERLRAVYENMQSVANGGCLKPAKTAETEARASGDQLATNQARTSSGRSILERGFSGSPDEDFNRIISQTECGWHRKRVQGRE